MVSVEDREQIRRAYFIEGMSIRAIAERFGHGRRVIRQAIASADPPRYQRQQPPVAPVLGSYKERIEQLLVENEKLPRKQRYTGQQIYKALCKAGYQGGESTVRHYVAEWRKAHKPPQQVFLPLAFEPGQDAQADWGEAIALIAGQRTTVQVFLLRLNYSRAVFVMAFPSQNQESFLEGHVQAFRFFGAVPRRITYDNLKTAVKKILEGHTREEQQTFVACRSHYLFEAFFCTPGQGHEKGGVENGVGYTRRNFLVPPPEVESFQALNAYLLAACQAELERQIKGQPTTIGEALAQERVRLLPLPAHDFLCCTTHAVVPNPYSQVTFQTNRYSVPVRYAGQRLCLRAFPFRIEVLALDQVIARHARCYEREQDIFDPLHYLPLLTQRPGAFDYARPIRQWREQWPAVYEELLAQLRQRWPEGQGIREFVQVLALHCEHPAEQVEQAVRLALEHGCLHAEGVKLCLRQVLTPAHMPQPLDLAGHPELVGIGERPVSLACYDQLLAGG